MRDLPARVRRILALWTLLVATTALATPAGSTMIPATGPQPSLTQPPAVDGGAQRIDQYRQQWQTERQLLDKDLQALGSRMDAQDKRFDDQAAQLGNILTLFGIVIAVLTVLLGAASLGTYVSARNKAESEAQDAAKKWFDDNSKDLHAEIERLRNEAQVAQRMIESRTDEVNEFADRAMQDMQRRLSQAGTEPGAVVAAPEPSPALEDAARALQKKPSSAYSFQDWNTLAFAAWQDGDREGAARHWHSAAALGGAPESVATALLNRGLALTELGRHEQAIGSWDEVIERFGEATVPALQEQVAKALFNKGFALDQLGRLDEAIASYDQVIERFGEATAPALQEQVAWALFNKGAALGQLGRPDEAIAACDQVIERCGVATAPALQEQVAQALVNKGVALGQLGRRDAAIAACEHVIERFGDSPEPRLRELVALARELKGKLQPKAEN